MAEHGPYGTEQEASATAAVRQARAAWDALTERALSDRQPVAGKHVPIHLKIMTDACQAAGVELGAFDKRTLEWLANYEDTTCQVIAGMVRRAWRAGLESAEPGDEIGWVVVTRSPLDPRWDVDTPGLHHERETAELERDDRRKHTQAVGRGERHEVAAVVRLEENL